MLSIEHNTCSLLMLNFCLVNIIDVCYSIIFAIRTQIIIVFYFVCLSAISLHNNKKKLLKMENSANIAYLVTDYKTCSFCTLPNPTKV